MIGRESEIRQLRRLYDSSQAEFVAVYGRRRVGKTYLIDETFNGKITFRHAGLSPIEAASGQNAMKKQLQHFYLSLQMHGMSRSHCPKSWMEAFYMLEQLLQSKDDVHRQLVFIDEMPWMDTARSGFITALEGFWNTWACHRHNLMLIVCGSATSWIQNKLINNHGGLYGRLTYSIHLSPFTLNECEQFCQSKHLNMSRYDIAQAYMIYGGIPYYWGFLQPGLSLDQNINQTFFGNHALLRDEFDNLFASVFSQPEQMKSIVRALYERRSGLMRGELIAKTGLKNNGVFSSMLQALLASDFVRTYVPFGQGKRQEYYQLTDPFCWFHMHFVRDNSCLSADFWKGDADHHVVSWRGLAFEQLCFNHIPQIKVALGIPGIQTVESAWIQAVNGTERGVQVDMLIRRADHVMNMCEMKFYNDDFTVSKEYERVVVRRQNALAPLLPRRTAIHNTLITTYGLTSGEYANVFQQVITLDHLFL